MIPKNSRELQPLDADLKANQQINFNVNPHRAGSKMLFLIL